MIYNDHTYDMIQKAQIVRKIDKNCLISDSEYNLCARWLVSVNNFVMESIRINLLDLALRSVLYESKRLP